MGQAMLIVENPINAGLRTRIARFEWFLEWHVDEAIYLG
jgi:hypothetical protein